MDEDSNDNAGLAVSGGRVTGLSLLESLPVHSQHRGDLLQSVARCLEPRHVERNVQQNGDINVCGHCDRVDLASPAHGTESSLDGRLHEQHVLPPVFTMLLPALQSLLRPVLRQARLEVQAVENYRGDVPHLQHGCVDHGRK